MRGRHKTFSTSSFQSFFSSRKSFSRYLLNHWLLRFSNLHLVVGSRGCNVQNTRKVYCSNSHFLSSKTMRGLMCIISKYFEWHASERARCVNTQKFQVYIFVSKSVSFFHTNKRHTLSKFFQIQDFSRSLCFYDCEYSF